MIVGGGDTASKDVQEKVKEVAIEAQTQREARSGLKSFESRGISAGAASFSQQRVLKCHPCSAPHRQRCELLREFLSPLLPKPNLVMRVGDSRRLLLLRWHCGKCSGQEWHRPCIHRRA
jgi:hypothetical protein